MSATKATTKTKAKTKAVKAKATKATKTGPRIRNKGLRLVRVADLEDAPWNFRVHTDAQRAAFEGTVNQIGWYGYPDVYQTERGALRICDGHLRKAFLIEKYGVDAKIEVNLTGFDEAEAKIATATHDPLAAMAEADSGKLEELLRSTKVDSEATQAMLDDLAAQNDIDLHETNGELVDPEPELDRAEELREKWGVERGDLWIFEGKQTHELLCGDATSGEDVGRVLDGNEPCLMVTDPPYGVNYDPNWRNEAAAKGQLAFAARRVGKVSNDDRIDWSEAYLLFPGDVAYTWSPPGDNQILTGQAVQKGGFQIRNQIMWRKPHFPISRGHYTYQHEPCWYGVRKGRTSHWIGDNAASTVWDITLDKNVEGGHSTQKPLECMARPIRNHEGDVYDPFVGSGTTLVAAENLGRRCFALEIEPRYCAVAIERMTAMDCKASKASSD